MSHLRSLTVLLFAFGAMAAVQAQTVIEGSFQHNGVEREYRLYIPAIYTGEDPVPLVFNLHGYGIENTAQEVYSDFRPIADTANFILVHPNGTIDEQGYRFWNTFGLPTVDDLGFLSALMDTLAANYSIDEDRIYSTGMSNGGMMTLDLACFRSERLAAVASVTGSMLAPRLSACAPTHPLPLMQIHGTADDIVPYEGGNGWVPVQELLDFWITYNNCSPIPVITPIPDTVPGDGSTVEHHVHLGIDAAGTTVELFKVLDGGHTWPGSDVAGAGTNHDIDASVEIWNFFRRYRLNEIITHTAAVEQAPFTVGLDPSSGDFHLRFNSIADHTTTVIDALGHIVLTERSNDMEERLHVEVPGIYLVTVEQNGRRWSERLMKY